MDIQIVSLFIAAVVPMALGALWYSPGFFGKRWMSLLNMSEEDMQRAKESGMHKTYGTAYLSWVFVGFVLVAVGMMAGLTTPLGLGLLGVLMWSGFAGTTSLSDQLWSGRPTNVQRELWLMNNSYSVLAYFLVGVVLGLF